MFQLPHLTLHSMWYKNTKMMFVLLTILLASKVVQGEWTLGRGIADITGLPGDGVLLPHLTLHSMWYKNTKMMFVVLTILLASKVVQGEWTLGRGIAEITGLPGDGVLYGYASLDQDARGIHTRQYCRSYIFDDGDKRAVVVVAEVAMISQAVHREVLELLDERYDGLYSASNVIMSPTHSHATPGGFHTYYMYSIPSGGFETPTFTTLVNGIVLSIDKAHEDMQPVHTTSMKRSNHLISTDNKGYASQMMERDLNDGQFPTEDILTAFLQTAVGDASPNVNHGRCEATDDLCSYNSSACPEDFTNPGLCLGRGPTGRYLEEMDDFEDTRIIGEKQYMRAMDLYNDAGEEMTNEKVDHRFIWAERPYPHWQPSVVPIQTIRIGDIVLIGIPAEITTMAGRRLVKAVKEVYEEAGEADIKPLVLSMANSYTSYLATKEEYQVQRYEGASVIFGPNTLLAYTDIVKTLAQAMIDDEPVDEGTWPPDLRGYPDEARGQTKFDLLPEDSDLTYGDVIVDVESSYGQGDIVQAIFVGANPRNNFYSMIDNTYMEVQRLDDDEWSTVYTDTHWETKYYWDSDCHGRWAINITGCGYEQTSNTTLEWTISEDEQPGTYRLFHRGHARTESDDVVPYSGESSEFTVVAQHRRKRSLAERISGLPRTGGWVDDDEVEDDWLGEQDELDEEGIFRVLQTVVAQW
ncbi:hypothetical protein CAPTEDRAFT_194498 [Capitella teleta]|uniref:Neutral ceramidase n=1 Tax=Capitella teleta TaxID=283909 RepID=R7T6Y3_CAPTE|nr:hypothetical protein CAPTEDRAFT_194498 [Capitella teleta]|eukprot:ELT89158.1 hypothetical protein CAPTEDRAFT_194498 [Capitella teleta]